MLKDSGAKILLTAMNSFLMTNSFYPSSSFIIHHSIIQSSCLYHLHFRFHGKPKGVPITHANLSPLLHWGYKQSGNWIKMTGFCRIYLIISIGRYGKFLLLLLQGPSLYMVPDELLLNSGDCMAFMSKTGLTVLHVTPTQYRYLLTAPAEDCETLKYLFFGAEKLTLDLLNGVSISVKRIAGYLICMVPTECTIISAVLEIERSGVRPWR